MQISLTELRRTPGPALDHVRGGEEVLITEDGLPMGRIVPIGRQSRYEELVLSGVIRPPVSTESPLSMRAFSITNVGKPEAIPPVKSPKGSPAAETAKASRSTSGKKK
jgi:prevent-host-death family protein